MAKANPSDVIGYAKSIEHERGTNATPLGKEFGAPKAASYATPKAHPDNPHTNKDTGSFHGDRKRSQRGHAVHPPKVAR